jgi:hypothetical protein
MPRGQHAQHDGLEGMQPRRQVVGQVRRAMPQPRAIVRVGGEFEAGAPEVDEQVGDHVRFHD